MSLLRLEEMLSYIFSSHPRYRKLEPSSHLTIRTGIIPIRLRWMFMRTQRSRIRELSSVRFSFQEAQVLIAWAEQARSRVRSSLKPTRIISFELLILRPRLKTYQ